MISPEFKHRIVEEVRKDSLNYDSAAKQAVAIGINSSQLSRIKGGDYEQVLSEAKWIHIARKLNVTLEPGQEWKVARTPVFQFIYGQLANCQQNHHSGLLCDQADIGKTFAAQQYARETKNAVYIDCSQVKSKQRFVRRIAQEFGVEFTGRYSDVYEDLCFYLRAAHKPLIILDEAGDLEYSAFLELKALWNATENNCGWYMMGADGLRAKIDKYRHLKKVGYTEIFSRFGQRFQKITPDGIEDRKQFIKEQTLMIAKANGASNLQSIYTKTGGSLRRVKIEVQKLKPVA
ncbi:MAG: ATP-binding protein [Flavobacteriales bacterium]|nr:ATP-binding protein [Flavobacteriales bacterium]